MREEAGKGLTLAAFKKLVREQFFMLLLDERRAVEAIPAMLDKDPDLASRMASNLRRIIDAVGLRSKYRKDRLAEIEASIRACGRPRALESHRASEITLGPCSRGPSLCSQKLEAR